jgi:MFS superfamily sulfate permease-like transporter
MLNQKHPMLALSVVLLWLGTVLAALFSAYHGLFAILAAVATVALFFFPIRYDSRQQVAEKAGTPLTAARSPLLLWGLLVAFFIGFCALIFGFGR